MIFGFTKLFKRPFISAMTRPLTWIFARWIELSLDVAVDRALDTHFCEQHWSAVFSSIDQHLNCKPPFRRIML
jgi:hypothetical protein